MLSTYTVPLNLAFTTLLRFMLVSTSWFELTRISVTVRASCSVLLPVTASEVSDAEPLDVRSVLPDSVNGPTPVIDPKLDRFPEVERI